MKKILFLFVGIIISNNLFSQVQFTKDTVYLEEKPVGYVSDLVSEERTITTQSGKEMTGPVLSYSITLFNLITEEEKKSIQLQYNPKSTPYIEVRFLEDFVFSNNQAKAGYLLYEAGKLKTQSNNLYLLSSVSASLGGILAQRAVQKTLAYNLMQFQGINTGNMQPPTMINRATPYIFLSLSSVLTITAVAKEYKANKKLKEAGIVLQR